MYILSQNGMRLFELNRGVHIVETNEKCQIKAGKNCVGTFPDRQKAILEVLKIMEALNSEQLTYRIGG